MHQFHAHKVGLVFGGIFALLRALWAFVVFLGLAKPLLDFITGLHFLSSQFEVIPFSFSTALTCLYDGRRLLYRRLCLWLDLEPRA